MIKALIVSILMFFPLLFGGNISHVSQNNQPFEQEIAKKMLNSNEFITYWMNDFRLDDEGQRIAICDITYNEYTIMYSKYAELNNADRTVVDNTPDYEEGYTIKDSILELVRIHGNMNRKQEETKQTLNQSTTIIIIVVIAVFGMSTICVFFVLKNNNVIQ